MRMRRFAGIAILAVAAACAPFAVLSLASATETATRGDPAEGGMLDLTQIAVQQDEHTLTLRAAFARPAAESLAIAGDGSRVCFAFERSSAERTICAVYSRGGLRVTRDRRAVNVTVKTSAEELVLRSTDAKLKLDPGRYTLRVVATAGLCDAATSPTPCEDTAPDRGAFEVRVWRVAVTGCKAKGALEVRHGPRVKRVALTFDDGPSGYTPSLLSKLRARNAKATFFILGRQAAGNGAIMRRAVRDGHALANHGWSHYTMGGGGPRATGELSRTQKALRSASGYTPCVFRPPYGDTGPDLRRRARDLGMTTIIWNVDPRDWATPGTGSIVNNVLANSGPGAIILMHDGGGNRSQTLAAVGPIIGSLRGRGYKFVTVPELLGYREVTTLTR